MLSVEAEVNGHPRDAAEGKRMLGGGIEVPCILQILCSQKEQSRF